MTQFKFVDEVCKCGLDLTPLRPERTRDEGAGVCPACGRTLLVVEVEPEPTRARGGRRRASEPELEPGSEPGAEPEK